MMILTIVATLAAAVFCGVASAAQVGMRGTSFTIDDKSVFLLGCSYYGGLGASDDAIRKDLDDLKKLGFNWIRVWATWTGFGSDISAVDRATGDPRQPYLDRLKWVIDQCNERHMIVDVTLSRGDGGIAPQRPHQRAVETLATELKSRPNWYIDLANEHNIRDKRFASFDDLAKLRDLVKKIDPARLVTASHAGGDLTRDELEKYISIVRVDFLSVHRPREADSPKQTAAHTQDVLAWMKVLNHQLPLHYDEPFRRGYGRWQPSAEDFLADLRAARESGAAGWCFHNGDTRGAKESRPRRSFDLRDGRLMDQLDEQEKLFLSALPGRMAAEK